jgi:hypothetical protein
MTDSEKEAKFDAAAAQALAGRLLDGLNDGALCLTLSVGQRVGLFDVLRDLPPATCAEIARRAGLNERYVREWLGAMVTGRVIEVDAENERFRPNPTKVPYRHY